MIDTTTYILLVEDDQNHVELIRRAFEDRGEQACLLVASTLAEARSILKKISPGLIVADWRLPDGDGLELLQSSHGLVTPPIIIMTSYGNERTAVSAIRMGALDYIVKSYETMLDMPHIAERAIQQWTILSEQERMRKELAEREAQFRLLAENSSDFISRHDARGIFLYASPACRTLVGYEPEELLGRSVLEFLHRKDRRRIIRYFRSLGNQIRNQAVSYRARHKNGEYIWLETTLRVIYDEHSGDLLEFQTSTRDISELRRAHADLQEAYEKTIEGWVHALDLRDRETEGHTQRVVDLTVRMARLVGISEEEIIHVRRGALLHDIGKLGVPDGILLKPGPLDEREWEIMRRHPTYAYELLSPIEYLSQALVIPYYHHERWNGEGYPQGLSGEQIPLAARLFSVVDVWDALGSDRPYRKRLPQDQVITYLRQQASILFDPSIVELFLTLI